MNIISIFSHIFGSVRHIHALPNKYRLNLFNYIEIVFILSACYFSIQNTSDNLTWEGGKVRSSVQTVWRNGYTK